MGFFNPLDVITGGVAALPGTGVSQAAINAGKVGGGVGQGSLAALGSGVGRNAPIYNPVQPPQNGPQPVPGMPPRSFDGPVIGTGFPGPGQPPFDPNVVINGGWGSEGPGGFTGHAQDPNFRPTPIPGGPYGNRGSGQPLNQPMGGGALAGLGMQVPVGGTPTSSQINAAWANMPGGQPTQSGYVDPSTLNSSIAGGAGLSQSDMVTMQGPDGTTKTMPRSEAAHWLSKGATMAMGG